MSFRKLRLPALNGKQTGPTLVLNLIGVEVLSTAISLLSSVVLYLGYIKKFEIG